MDAGFSSRENKRLQGAGDHYIIGEKMRSGRKGGVIEHDFHASAPNTKWLSHLTEFQLRAGKV